MEAILQTYTTQAQPEVSLKGPREEINAHWQKEEERRPRKFSSSLLVQCVIPGKDMLL